jgi:hypothetical protein
MPDSGFGLLVVDVLRGALGRLQIRQHRVQGQGPGSGQDVGLVRGQVRLGRQ